MALTSRYSFFFTLQSIGAAILFYYAVPLYRQVLLDPAGHEVRAERLIWGLTSIGLMQAGYWMRHRFNPSLPRFRNSFLGHVIQFVGRFAFVFATSVFGSIFIIRRPELAIPASRYAVLVAGLFALFCYAQEMGNLGRALNGSKE